MIPGPGSGQGSGGGGKAALEKHVDGLDAEEPGRFLVALVSDVEETL